MLTLHPASCTPLSHLQLCKMGIMSPNPETQVESSNAAEKTFSEYVLTGDWNEVIRHYEEHDLCHTEQITKSRGTALHVAVNHCKEGYVKRLVSAIIMHEKDLAGKRINDAQGETMFVSALRSTDELGNTALHLAARRGSKSMCKCIIGENAERKELVKVTNYQGESPLFIAAVTYKTKVFGYLHDVSKEDTDVPLRNNYGNTILHRAIQGELFDLAIVIIKYYPQLVSNRNNDGVTPLKFLASRPSAFRSGTTLSWWKQIIYHCITVKELDPVKEMSSYLEKKDISEDVHDQHKRTPRSKEKYPLPVVKTSLGSENEDKKLPYSLVIPTCATFFGIARSIIRILFGHLGLSHLGIIGVGIKEIRMMKQKHVWGLQLLNLFMEKSYESYMGYVTGYEPEVDQDEVQEQKDEVGPPFDLDQTETEEKDNFLQFIQKMEDATKSEANIDKKESAYLIAARNGIIEIVNKVQQEIPSVLDDITSEKENVLLVAMKNRQPFVVEELKKDKDQFETLLSGVDKNENTILHLAARAAINTQKTWQISGSAMQMMWDIKWYQYIRGLVPHYFRFRNNNDGEKADEIFDREHENLVEKSSEWLKGTSESCSVVAALIAGVAFATSSTVPGGTEEGKPALEGQPAFDTFAISSLIGLFFSVTSLIMFLAILTSRKQAQDFRRSLPLKLLLCLSSLFISIASMLISFCAAHFFVLKDKYKSILFPVYVATCLPVTFYAIVQFPLYVDLVKAIFKDVPQPKGEGGQF